jgi:XTP/dITP diphosphohydrolase
MNTRETQLKAFDRLLGIMEELQNPWDKSKHFKRYETYRNRDAILDNDLLTEKRIGDLLLHIVF